MDNDVDEYREHFNAACLRKQLATANKVVDDMLEEQLNLRHLVLNRERLLVEGRHKGQTFGPFETVATAAAWLMGVDDEPIPPAPITAEEAMARAGLEVPPKIEPSEQLTLEPTPAPVPALARRKYTRLTPGTVAFVETLLQVRDELSFSEIAAKAKIDSRTVYRINQGEHRYRTDKVTYPIRATQLRKRAKNA